MNKPIESGAQKLAKLFHAAGREERSIPRPTAARRFNATTLRLERIISRTGRRGDPVGAWLGAMPTSINENWTEIVIADQVVGCPSMVARGHQAFITGALEDGEAWQVFLFRFDHQDAQIQQVDVLEAMAAMVSENLRADGQDGILGWDLYQESSPASLSAIITGPARQGDQAADTNLFIAVSMPARGYNDRCYRQWFLGIFTADPLTLWDPRGQIPPDHLAIENPVCLSGPALISSAHLQTGKTGNLMAFLVWLWGVAAPNLPIEFLLSPEMSGVTWLTSDHSIVLRNASEPALVHVGEDLAGNLCLFEYGAARIYVERSEDSYELPDRYAFTGRFAFAVNEDRQYMSVFPSLTVWKGIEVTPRLTRRVKGEAVAWQVIRYTDTGWTSHIRCRLTNLLHHDQQALDVTAESDPAAIFPVIRAVQPPDLLNWQNPTLHLVYLKARSGGGWDLVYREWNGAQWGVEELRFRDLIFDPMRLAMAIGYDNQSGEDNVLHIIARSGGRLLHLRKWSQGWSREGIHQQAQQPTPWVTNLSILDGEGDLSGVPAICHRDGLGVEGTVRYLYRVPSSA